MISSWKSVTVEATANGKAITHKGLTMETCFRAAAKKLGLRGKIRFWESGADGDWAVYVGDETMVARVKVQR